MANVELDENIKKKLREAFSVLPSQIDEVLQFFNTQLKPAISVRYLSHLVSSIEEMINDAQKKAFLEELKSLKLEKDARNMIGEMVQQKRLRLFSIILVEVEQTKGRRAKCYPMKGGIMICYAKYLDPNERRFAIAHELGHIVNEHLLKLNMKNNNKEYLASLFAYIALVDKNNFYQKGCKDFVCSTEYELFRDYMNLLHKQEYLNMSN